MSLLFFVAIFFPLVAFPLQKSSYLLLPGLYPVTHSSLSLSLSLLLFLSSFLFNLISHLSCLLPPLFVLPEYNTCGGWSSSLFHVRLSDKPCRHRNPPNLS